MRVGGVGYFGAKGEVRKGGTAWGWELRCSSAGEAGNRAAVLGITARRVFAAGRSKSSNSKAGATVQPRSCIRGDRAFCGAILLGSVTIGGGKERLNGLLKTFSSELSTFDRTGEPAGIGLRSFGLRPLVPDV